MYVVRPTAGNDIYNKTEEDHDKSINPWRLKELKPMQLTRKYIIQEAFPTKLSI